MTDAPEWIWAGECHFRWWQTESFGNLAEYIRADLHEAIVADERRKARREALEEAARAVRRALADAPYQYQRAAAHAVDRIDREVG